MDTIAWLRSARMFGIALFDVLATLAVAAGYSAYKRRAVNLRDMAVKFLLLLLVGELLHLLLEVDTRVTRYLTRP